MIPDPYDIARDRPTIELPVIGRDWVTIEVLSCPGFWFDRRGPILDYRALDPFLWTEGQRIR